jgi:hypothetical protein
MKPCCKNCRAYVPMNTVSTNSGSCHRISPGHWRHGYKDVYQWPAVSDNEWCLEWVELKAEETALDRVERLIKCMMPIADSIEEGKGINLAINHILRIIAKERKIDMDINQMFRLNEED